MDDIIHLVRCKLEYDDDQERAQAVKVGAKFKPDPVQWEEMAARMQERGVNKDEEECKGKWAQEMSHYRRIHDYQGESGKPDFFDMNWEEKQQWKIALCMRREVYDVFEECYGKDHSISPPNLSDTGVPFNSSSPGSSGAECATCEGQRDAGWRRRKTVREKVANGVVDAIGGHGASMTSAIDRGTETQAKSDKDFVAVLMLLVEKIGVNAHVMAEAMGRGAGAGCIVEQVFL
ncbi:hypothetical protein CBR_g8858 [Chara braunii]|uniref:Myb/SANT-like DNA-binding domain-containing protein n=1 Tax=Chara braunii TaxID=69332 RepID=A0A388KN04_CHABU|nr:hypothetical protein CBR_g8858 [Chara braunii]|eukprot:GBG71439.1 hypothetical protein CBR_g8858 [Chara braunii]